MKLGVDVVPYKNTEVGGFLNCDAVCVLHSKIEATSSSEMLVNTHNTIRRHSPKDHL
jgi:hypothetical protein